MATQNQEFDIDSVIQRLLEVRGSRPGKTVILGEHEIKNLCLKAREIFINQPVLLELEAPIKICGKFVHTGSLVLCVLLSLFLSISLCVIYLPRCGAVFATSTWLSNKLVFCR